MWQTKKAELAITAFWLVAVAAGGWYLSAYEFKAGTQSNPPTHLAGMPIDAPAPNKHLLMMFVHPKCPCTQASLAEYERLLVKCGSKVDARIVAVSPPGISASHTESDLLRRAAHLPGVRVVPDTHGAVARKFLAHTSGETLLYDNRGSLQFQGGITGSRGHEGNNPGSQAVLSAVSGELRSPAKTPVFGCSLFDAMTTSCCGTTCSQ